MTQDLLSFSALIGMFRILNVLILSTMNVNTQPGLCHYMLLIWWRHTALCKCVCLVGWLNDCLFGDCQRKITTPHLVCIMRQKLLSY